MPLVWPESLTRGFDAGIVVTVAKHLACQGAVPPSGQPLAAGRPTGARWSDGAALLVLVHPHDDMLGMSMMCLPPIYWR